MAAGEITARQIEDELRVRLDSLVPELLPRAVLDGGYWCVGNVRGDSGTQMKVNSSTGKRGLWTDWSAPQGSDEYSGDMLKLIAVIHYGGWSDKDSRAKAIGWAKHWLGWDSAEPAAIEQRARESRERIRELDEAADAAKAGKRRSAAAMWHGAAAGAGTPAQAYVEGRVPGLVTPERWPGSLRFVPDAWCPVRRGKHPAVIACIVLDGKLVGVHRTYLDVSRGKRGPVRVFKLPPDAKGRRKSHKLSLGDYAGGHIPLAKGACPRPLHGIAAGTPVYVSEGIEDGLTIALARPEARVVAGVALSNMGGLVLPPQAGPLIFIGQNDPIGGQAAAAFERVVARQQAAGREVKIIWPEPAYKDFNDQLLGLRMREAAA